MPRTDVGGGARILIEHASRLQANGNDVTVVSHGPRPDWVHLDAPFVRVPFGLRLSDGIPPTDVIVAGYWDQVIEARATGLAPVVHFEQGDFHLYEDLAPEVLRFVQDHLDAADRTITVSEQTARVLHHRYGIRSDVFHNAVDLDVFFPGAGLPPETGEVDRYMLLVGWDGQEFKGIADALKAWDLLKADDPGLRLVWVTPRPPAHATGTVVVSPRQEALAELYRRAAVYVCASHYESFPLPPLEAMACGAPVVTTANVGALEYARHGENCLVVPLRDPSGLAGGIRTMLSGGAIRARCRSGGLQTAQRFSWPVTIQGLHSYYADLAASAVEPASQPDEWEVNPELAEAIEPAELGRLVGFLPRCHEKEAQFPVLSDVGAGQLEAQWVTVARRLTGYPGRARFWSPVLAKGPVAAEAHDGLAQAQRLIMKGQPGLALRVLQDLKSGSDDATGAVRWMVLALIAAGHLDKAEAIVRMALEDWPDHPDFWRLGATVRSGRLTTREREILAGALELLGPGARFSRWFVA